MKVTNLFLILILGLSFCTSPGKKLPEVNPDFKKVLEAHGDWSKWVNAKGLSFTLFHETSKIRENHFFNLDSREGRVDSQNFQIGFDGENVWISPNREAFSGRSIKFYHNLYFYFFNIPYILTDPGVKVEKIENRTLNGQSFETFQASFESGTGDSPDDQYFLLINPETSRLEWLIYKVTFFDPENKSFNALKYEDYRDVGGLVFPRILTGYTLEVDSTTNIRYQVSFGDVVLQNEEFDEVIFQMPEDGVKGD